MLSLITIALAMQAQITEADVPVILESVAEYVVSDTASIPGILSLQDRQDRRVFIADEKTKAAFGEAVSNLQQLEVASGSSYATLSESDAVQCSDRQKPVTCRVPEDGVLLTIEEIEPRPTPRQQQDENQYLIHLSVQWNDETGVVNRPITLSVAESNDRWLVTGTLYWAY